MPACRGAGGFRSAEPPPALAGVPCPLAPCAGPCPHPRPCVGPPLPGRSGPALLLQTASGNVEAKVVCFYRRRDISSSLIALADKHASESSRALPHAPGPSAGGGAAVHVLAWTAPCTVQGSQAWGWATQGGRLWWGRAPPVGSGPRACMRTSYQQRSCGTSLRPVQDLVLCPEGQGWGSGPLGPPRACAHQPGTACGLPVLSRGFGSWRCGVSGPGPICAIPVVRALRRAGGLCGPGIANGGQSPVSVPSPE